ncbi:MAG: HAMP domain-containing histidine kinase [Lachnospiraceae bacterium]|nr:HAMP domain-containing histidine kinase [Lachnospiraceae bacterium]
MERGRQVGALLALLAAGLFGMFLTVLLLTGQQRQRSFVLLEKVFQETLREHPEAEEALLDGLKGYQNRGQEHFENRWDERSQGGGFLTEHGYAPSDFFMSARWRLWGSAFGILGSLFLLGVFYWRERRRVVLRIEELTLYLVQVNAGDASLLLKTREDAFSRLQDELYKTVTALRQSRDGALAARRAFGENLANIAHQLKTPLTAISLSAQLLKEENLRERQKQIERQMSRLIHLEESLLLLSRLDAGALHLSRRPADVFTLLSLAADHLEELLAKHNVQVDIPEWGAVEVLVDVDWTLEALINLLKNCMEHTPFGTWIHCSYEKNPLYVEICIWDEGPGFAQEDLPYLFDRFYCGQGQENQGIGIGLSLAREILELQKGVIRAKNLPGGGACFEIHLYHP